METIGEGREESKHEVERVSIIIAARSSAAALAMTLFPDNQNDRNCDNGDKKNKEAYKK